LTHVIISNNIEWCYPYQFHSGQFQLNDTFTVMVTIICNVNTTLSAGCPTDVTITPFTGTFEASDELMCGADGYNPTYSWTGTAGVNGDIVSEMGDTYTVPEGPFNVICIATVDELSCCDSTNVSDTAYSKYQQESLAISEDRGMSQ